MYAATPTFSTFQLILAHALSSDFSMYIGDVSTAFLHASVFQPTYVSPPEDYQTDSKEKVVWKLKRAMYGLKPAPKSWQEHLKEVLQEIGLQQMRSDSRLLNSADKLTHIIVHVDDLFIAGLNKVTVIKIITEIRKRVLFKEVGWLQPGTSLHY